MDNLNDKLLRSLLLMSKSTNGECQNKNNGVLPQDSSCSVSADRSKGSNWELVIKCTISGDTPGLVPRSELLTFLSLETFFGLRNIRESVSRNIAVYDMDGLKFIFGAGIQKSFSLFNFFASSILNHSSWFFFFNRLKTSQFDATALTPYKVP